MALVFSVKPAFVSGQISPRTYGRVDLDQYATGLEQCKNFIVLPHGGATFRTGTRYVAETKNSAAVHLIPFSFSSTQSYVIEAGFNYFRFFINQAKVEDPGSPPDPLEVTTTYTLSQLESLKYAQSGDIMYLVERTTPPKVLSRIANDDWTLTDFDFQDGPYYSENVTTTTLGFSALTGSITVTASATEGINNDTGFASTDVGRLIRVKTTEWSWLKITAYTSPTEVTATVRGPNLAATTAVTTWRMGAWSDTDGWPEAVTFHQQRLMFARGQYVWGTKVGEFDNLSPTDVAGVVVDDDAVTYRLASNKINLIEWLQSSRTLEIGTAGQEFTMNGTGQIGIDSPLTPDSVIARKTTENGSAPDEKPIFTSNGTVFLNRSRRKLYNYYYSFQSDNYIVDDLTILSEDITSPSIVDMTYSHEPHKLLFAVRSDGVLLGCTFNPQQDVVAWHYHEIGGTDSEVEAITSIPSLDGFYDETYIAVKRTVNGSTVRYLEVMEPLFDNATAVEDAFFVDSGLTYDSTPTTSITNLGHLEGEEVTILADGKVHPVKTVTSGAITLDYNASVVHVGLPYIGRLRLLPFETGAINKSYSGRKARVVSVGVKYYQTILGEVGIDGKPLELFNERTFNTPFNTAISPTDGFVRVPVAGDTQYQSKVVVEQNYPLPCTILSIYPMIDT